MEQQATCSPHGWPAAATALTGPSEEKAISNPGEAPEVRAPSARARALEAFSDDERAVLLDALLDRAGAAVTVSRVASGTGDLQLVVVNDAFAELVGGEVEDLVGQSPRDAILSDIAPDLRARIGELISRGERWVGEVGLRTASGELVPAEISIELLAPSGADRLLLATYRDLRDRHAAADALWRSEEWAQAIVRSISDVMLVTNREGVITWCSPSVGVRLGYTPDDLIGRSGFDFIHPDDVARAMQEFEDTITEPSGAGPVEFRVRHADGSYRTVAVNSSAQLDHPAIEGVILTFSDVTERARVEERLRHSEQWAQRLVQGGSDLVLVMDGNSTVTYASPALEHIMGYGVDEFVGESPMTHIHPEDRELAARAFSNSRVPDVVELRVRTKGGEWKLLDCVVSDLRDDPVVAGVVVNVRDVTSRRRAEELLAEQADLLEAIARGAPLEITLQKITQMIEHSIEGALCAVGMRDTDGAIRVRAAPSLPRQIVNILDQLSPDISSGVLADGAVAEYDLSCDGPFTDQEMFAGLGLGVCRIAPLQAPGSGDLLGALTVFEPRGSRRSSFEAELLSRARNLAAIAIERRRFESTLEYQALYDNLTGLPNRTLLHTRIEDALRRADRLHTGVAVLFIDLDRFKRINDSVGHALGDQLLQLVGERLRDPLRPGDTLGRFGGDKFMVVCNRIEDEEAAVKAAERFGAVLMAPFRLGGGEIFVTTSIGISFATEPSVSAEQMIRNADVAMYRAKEQGRNQHAMFEAHRDQRKVEQLAIEQALRVGIEEGEFELHFQPAVRLRDGAMNHVEALVRWNRPGHGMVMPGLFIPIAEETGLIVPLGWWVLEKSCELAVGWPQLPSGDWMQVAVNLSARQLAAPELHDVVTGVLERTGLEPWRLCFEVTESDLVHDVDRAVTALEDLKALGVKIAIDDFGTGYASLEYIRHFTMADYLKIDRSFVDGMEEPGSQQLAIVTAAIAMAKSLGLKTVAEGVETMEQAVSLRELDCDLAQGYLFSRPVPVDDAIAITAAPPTAPVG